MSLSLLLCAAASFAAGPADEQTTPAASTASQPTFVDAELEAYRRRLLDLAFTTASAIPVHPHTKDRARAQQDVATVCLELGQLRMARTQADAIANWRRGEVCADLALRCLEAGAKDDARALLAIAQAAADDLDQRLKSELEDDELIESPQDWQRDRIRMKIAKALFVHGEAEKAEALEAGAVESEAGQLDATRARHASLEDFEVLISELEGEVLSASFEQARFAMEACVELFDRFYDDPPRRARAEAAFRKQGAKLTQDVLVAILRSAGERALAHKDFAKALELTHAADAIVKGKCGSESGWIPEHEIPLRASLVALRFHAGESEAARTELAVAIQRYDDERANINDLFRAETVRPLAEAALAIGDRAGALVLYRRALEDGAENPNARPRAEDLVATCLSLAEHDLEPDAELWQRILAVNAGLKQPW